MKKVSLIIPVYNTEKYLRRCLHSACNQTYKNLEIICIDDGSTDGSSMILDKFADNCDRIRVFHQANRGESAARNKGLSYATGDYIAFMDCDDWIEPDMYSHLVDTMESKNMDLVAAGWYSDTEENSQPVYNQKEINSEVMDRSSFLRCLYERDAYRGLAYMWNKLYKRELLCDVEGKPILFDENLQLGGDVLFLGQVALNVERACYIDVPYYHYLQREDSGCHSKNIKKRQDWLRAYILLINQFEEAGVEKNTLGYVKRFLGYHSCNLAELAYEQGDRQALAHCQKIMSDCEAEYCRLNHDVPERIQKYQKVLGIKI